MRVCVHLQNHSARAGYDTGSIFKRILAGFNSVFLSPRPVALLFTRSWRENSWIHPFSKTIRELQIASSLELRAALFSPLVVHALAGCGACCTVRSGVSHHWIYLWSQEVIPQALTLLGGVRFIAWSLRRTEKGNVGGARGVFGNDGRVWAAALRPDPP